MAITSLQLSEPANVHDGLHACSDAVLLRVTLINSLLRINQVGSDKRSSPLSVKRGTAKFAVKKLVHPCTKPEGLINQTFLNVSCGIASCPDVGRMASTEAAMASRRRFRITPH